MTELRNRRWKKRRRLTTEDVAVWVTFTVLTAAVLLAMCLLLTIAWPS